MNKHYKTQFETANNYFNHLYEYGYLNDEQTLQTLSTVLLIDCLDYFKDIATVEFQQDIDRIIHNLECCVCTIGINNIKDNCSC